MVINEILVDQLLNQSESDTLDFKAEEYKFAQASDDEKSELLKDVLAFTNAFKKKDAFILVGVREIKGGRSIPLGINAMLDDAPLQQFVNSKTQKAVSFSYSTISFQNVKLGVFHIPIQKRPIYLTKNYGRLKKNIVYLRRGTSTDEASPDEIARMGSSVEERKISGVSAKLLEYMIKDANERLYSMPTPNEIIGKINIELTECKDAIEELRSLGLIQVSVDANSPIGYARVQLFASTFIRFASQVLKDIDVADEVKKILSVFPNNGDFVSSESVLESTKIPLVRLQLIVNFLLEKNCIEATKYFLGENKLNFMHGRLLPAGKRILRGDDPLTLSINT